MLRSSTSVVAGTTPFSINAPNASWTWADGTAAAIPYTAPCNLANGSSNAETELAVEEITARAVPTSILHTAIPVTCL